MSAMKPGRRPTAGLTEREMEIMTALWTHGPMHVREIAALYTDDAPRPHINTLSTIIRILEEKGHVAHEAVGGSFRYYAVTPQDEFRERSLKRLVSNFFNNSYKMAVSALVEEEKVSVDELRDIIRMIEKKN